MKVAVYYMKCVFRKNASGGDGVGFVQPIRRSFRDTKRWKK